MKTAKEILTSHNKFHINLGLQRIKLVLALLDNPQKLIDMRLNIENEWKKNMSWSPIADKYIQCYKSLLQE